MKYLLRWIVPASALEGEWTLPAPSNFDYQMMMLRERIRRFQIALMKPFREVLAQFWESMP